jgi:hypothetical protein
MTSYLGYRFALLATLILTAVNFAVLIHVAVHRPAFAGGVTIYTVATLLLAFGLWVHSQIARYVGAAWALLSLTSAVWPIASGGKLVWGPGLL